MFSVEGSQDFLLAEVSGDVDIASSQSFRAFLMSLADTVSDRWIIVDLSRCRYIDSSGLGALIRAKLLVDKIILVVPSENHTVRRLFDRVNFGSQFAIEASRGSAIAFAQDRGATAKAESA
jgi:anti-anti-sigma factor